MLLVKTFFRKLPVKSPKKLTFLILIFLTTYFTYFRFINLRGRGNFKSNFERITFKNVELFEDKDGGLELQPTKSHPDFHLLLGRIKTSTDNPTPIIQISENRLELTYSKLLKLSIHHHLLPTHSLTTTDSPTTTTDCYNLHWLSLGGIDVFTDQLYLGDSYWFGGALMGESYWPMNGRSHSLAPFVTGDSYNNYYGSIQERFWMSSSGVGIFIDYNTPLFIDINQQLPNHLTITSQFTPPFSNSQNHPLSLNYTLCFAANPRNMFLTASRNFWKTPTTTPNHKLFNHPSWSTWASFKWGITETVIKQYARDISKMGCRDNHMVIDDGWMKHYGDFSFHPTNFPHASDTIHYLHQLNFTVSLWFHPFSSFYSSSFWQTDSDGYSFWTHLGLKWMPALMLWWNGVGAALDLTNHQTITWFAQQLINMSNTYKINAFKFDAGESSWLPTFKSFKHPLDNPNDYTTAFTHISELVDSGSHLMEIRSSSSQQHLPTFVRLIDKNSDWSEHNGLRSIIPQALTVGLLGYPFILPDMIGGNAYYGMLIHLTIQPPRELYIRWIQVSALMPSMQFSIGPWTYDDEVVDIAQKMINLHTFFSHYIISLAHQSTNHGAPIVRPIWWQEEDRYHIPEEGMDGGKDGGKNEGMNKNGEERNGGRRSEGERGRVVGGLYRCESEFLLGDEILVAPILYPNATTRWVVFPRGVWVRGRMEKGGRKYGEKNTHSSSYETQEVLKTNAGGVDSDNGGVDSDTGGVDSNTGGGLKRIGDGDGGLKGVLRGMFEGVVHRGRYEKGMVYRGYEWYEVKVSLHELAYFVKVAELL